MSDCKTGMMMLNLTMLNLDVDKYLILVDDVVIDGDEFCRQNVCCSSSTDGGSMSRETNKRLHSSHNLYLKK